MIKKVVSFDNDEFAFELIQVMADDNHAKFNELLRTWVDIHGLSRSQYGREQEALSNFMENNIFRFWDDHGFAPYDDKMIYKMLVISQLDIDRLTDLLTLSEIKSAEPIIQFVLNTSLIYAPDLGNRIPFLKKLIALDGGSEAVKQLTKNAIDILPTCKKTIAKKMFLMSVFNVFLDEPELSSDVLKGIDKNRYDDELSKAIVYLDRPRYNFYQALYAYHMDFKKTSVRILNDLCISLTGIQAIVASLAMNYEISDMKIHNMLINANYNIKKAALNYVLIKDSFVQRGMDRFNIFNDTHDFLKHTASILSQVERSGIKYDDSIVAKNIEQFIKAKDKENKDKRFTLSMNDSLCKLLIKELPERLINKSAILKRLALEEDFGL